MKLLIIEDEEQAAKRLESLIRAIDNSIEIVGKTDSVKQSVQWLEGNAAPDLILMDIQLGDGLSFEIFEKTSVDSPVIFTTAYDEYALKAFKVNSIDYILKPVDKQELEDALRKFEVINKKSDTRQVVLNNIDQVVQLLTKKYKERFVIKVGEHLRTVETRSILYFYSHDKTTFAHTEDGRNYILDFTLEQLEGLLNPAEYFRVNRKHMVSTRSLQDIISYSNSRLRLVLKGSQDQDVIVSRERVQSFKQWLDH
jgi:DNA-binding LytR/AlgR family response regulator